MNPFQTSGGPLSKRGIAGIVIGNLLPVFGVLFLGWDAGLILILYWIENLIVGAFTLPRILTAMGPAPAQGSAIGGSSLGGRLFIAIFFCFHYGMFWIGHGVFALMLASSFDSAPVAADAAGPIEAVGGMAVAEEAISFLIAVGAMVVIHAVAFWRTWIQPRAWRTASPNEEMFRPYGRIFVLHLTVLLGAFGLSSVGAPAWTMIVLCVGKMALELGLAGVSLLGRRRVDQST